MDENFIVADALIKSDDLLFLGLRNGTLLTVKLTKPLEAPPGARMLKVLAEMPYEVLAEDQIPHDAQYVKTEDVLIEKHRYAVGEERFHADIGYSRTQMRWYREAAYIEGVEYETINVGLRRHAKRYKKYRQEAFVSGQACMSYVDWLERLIPPELKPEDVSAGG